MWLLCCPDVDRPRSQVDDTRRTRIWRPAQEKRTVSLPALHVTQTYMCRRRDSRKTVDCTLVERTIKKKKQSIRPLSQSQNRHFLTWRRMTVQDRQDRQDRQDTIGFSSGDKIRTFLLGSVQYSKSRILHISASCSTCRFMERDQREMESRVVGCVSAITCFVSRQRALRSTTGRKTAAGVREKRKKDHKTSRVGERALFSAWPV